MREVKVAMVADVGTLQRLPHIIGEGHARQLADPALVESARVIGAGDRRRLAEPDRRGLPSLEAHVAQRVRRTRLLGRHLDHDYAADVQAALPGDRFIMSIHQHSAADRGFVREQ